MKNLTRTLLFSSLLAASSLQTASAEECGEVTIADMNWNSATLIANVDKFILQHGFDCDAELVPGDTQPTGASMISKGQPDIAPEFWSNSMREALDMGVKDGQIQYAGTTLTDGGEEGFWVPEYMVAKDPSMATIEGVLANAKMFKHPEDPSKSAFYSCPAGWNCQISAGNLFTALGMEEKGFEVIDQGQVRVYRVQLQKLMSAKKHGLVITGHRQRFLVSIKWLKSTLVVVLTRRCLKSVSLKKRV
ncbi:L-proline glycine betaine binding ABC transporter protein ProX [Vibrio maritimus]|uniref:L-proline glycine betaine binding ABC transporter protein ProX n=1 Tax=Vibrio maritimus TaxID=990268 RepID=A0A090T2A6_9VIBR|nr:L-proline glycine betaine binding ABC transporter protein ProX [Vibrio maritimus]